MIIIIKKAGCLLSDDVDDDERVSQESYMGTEFLEKVVKLRVIIIIIIIISKKESKRLRLLFFEL